MRAALKEIDGITVDFFYPQTFTTLQEKPAVSYREIANLPKEYADDEEYTSEISIQIDIYAISTAVAGKVAKQISSKLKKLDYKRDNSYDLPDPSGYAHKTMRFTKIVSEETEDEERN